MTSGESTGFELQSGRTDRLLDTLVLKVDKFNLNFMLIAMPSAVISPRVGGWAASSAFRPKSNRFWLACSYLFRQSDSIAFKATIKSRIFLSAPESRLA